MLRVHDPGNMEEAMDWAVKIEEKLIAAQGPKAYGSGGHQQITKYNQYSQNT